MPSVGPEKNYKSQNSNVESFSTQILNKYRHNKPQTLEKWTNKRCQKICKVTKLQAQNLFLQCIEISRYYRPFT